METARGILRINGLETVTQNRRHRGREGVLRVDQQPSRNGRAALVVLPRQPSGNGDRLAVTPIAHAAAIGKPPDAWLCQLSSDRPTYACPNCKESGMQFFAERRDMPGREDFFYCHACGSNWEM